MSDPSPPPPAKPTQGDEIHFSGRRDHGEDAEEDGTSPKQSPETANGPGADGWDGDDRTLIQGPAAWDGDDRTTVPKPATWDGDERTSVPLPDGAPSEATGSTDWDGDDNTVVPGQLAEAVDQTPIVIPITDAFVPPKSRATASEIVRMGGDWLHEGRSGPLSGSTLGDFLVGNILGEGGMGLVYRAQQISLHRRAALKVLASNFANDDSLVRRFYAEAHTASLIASQHVVQVYFVGEAANTVFYAMEFVEGKDLSKLAQGLRQDGHPMSADQALNYIEQAADGLAAAALRNIVHRDIKPQNLLVTPQGVVKIADFGIAKVLDEQSQTLAGQTVGTPSYCSPEQGRGTTVDHRSDLYSLGVVLYELLTGKKPFVAHSANVLIYQHNYTEPKAPRSLDETIPEAYEAVVMRLLMKDPAQRYQSATDLVTDLRRLREGLTSSVPAWTPAQGTGAKAALARDQGWRRKLLIPAVVAMLLIGIGTVWGMSHVSSRQEEQGEIQRRRLSLMVLDHPLPPPVSASEDLAWLAPRLGDSDVDLVRWQAKLTRLTDLEERLTTYFGGGLLASKYRRAATTALAAYINEVGKTAAKAQRWSAVLTATDSEIARLKTELAVIDGKDRINHAAAVRLNTVISNLKDLAPANDPDLQRWAAFLAGRDQRLATLRGRLVILDAQNQALIEPQVDQLNADLVEWTALSANNDVNAARWATPLNAFRERLTGLRARLERLNHVDQPNLPLIEELAADLAACRAMTAPEDPQRRAWETKVAATIQRVAALRGSLAELLDPSAPLSLDRLETAERLLGNYRAEVSPDDGRLAAWERRANTERRDLAALREGAERLNRPGRLSAAERASAQNSVAALAARKAAGQAELAAWHQRLDDEAREVKVLRESLAVHATAGTLLSQTAGETAAALASIVGAEDAEAQRLLAQRNELLRLAERLAVLDQLASEPPNADSLHARWIALTPAGETNGQRWSIKLTRILAARAACAPLDRVQEPPAECRLRLDELRNELVGPNDTHVLRWSTRLAEIERLRQQIGKAISAPVLLPGVTADLAALTALVGESAELAGWQARARMLLGPPQPTWAEKAGHDRAGPWVALSVAGLNLRLRQVAAGTVVLGSPLGEEHRDDDEGPTTVRLTHSFWLAETEVTQRLWTAVMANNPSAFRGLDRPVDSVSWNDALEFCKRLGVLVPGLEPRLPSEAEWEFACRTGSASPYHGPDGPVGANQLGTIAWFDLADGTREVARLAPNRLGLFDMHGNVWEWCADRYDQYPAQLAEDWVGSRGEHRVVRGCSWADPLSAARAANRVALSSDARSRMVGLRIAATITTVAP